jgi:hypothetical protein
VDKSSSFQHAIEDRLGQIRIVQHLPPCIDGLVRRKDHRTTMEVPVVDDLKQNVRRIESVTEISNFIDDKHRRVRVIGKHGSELPVATGGG